MKRKHNAEAPHPLSPTRRLGRSPGRTIRGSAHIIRRQTMPPRGPHEPGLSHPIRRITDVIREDDVGEERLNQNAVTSSRDQIMTKRNAALNPKIKNLVKKLWKEFRVFHK